MIEDQKTLDEFVSTLMPKPLFEWDHWDYMDALNRARKMWQDGSDEAPESELIKMGTRQS
ncbi:MAG: hypothetical protein ACTSQZ_09725 [Candidatus Thorarchaeota archaeon]